jgi:hypothetical protein
MLGGAFEGLRKSRLWERREPRFSSRQIPSQQIPLQLAPLPQADGSGLMFDSRMADQPALTADI